MSGSPEISVVVATYNRAATLRETLACLRAQSLGHGRFEVIVVDDGSSDDTRETVEQDRALCAFDFTYLRHPNRGPGFTQNRGIREARAPIVLLIADDIFLAPSALEAHLAMHAAHPAATTAVLGRVLQSPTLDDTVFLSKWDPWHLGGLPDGMALPYTMFWACNISFKREFMFRHGMFRDEMGRAGAAAHEDVELGYRLQQHGLQIRCGQGALGYHHHVETLEGTLRRSRQRGLNWYDFRQQVPEVEIDITYRVYDLATLWFRRSELTGSRRAFLLESDRSLPKLAFRYLLRCALFNRASVRLVWLPLFAAAERSRLVARLVHENMYRGVVVHYFIRGFREACRQYGSLPLSRSAEGG